MEDGEQITFGHFFDEIYEWAEKNGNGGHFFMERWTQLEETVMTFEKARVLPLSDGLVRAFAQDMQTYFIDYLAISVDTVSIVTREGHAFLMAIHGIASKLGIELDLREIDVTLSPMDYVIAIAHSSVHC